MFNVYLYVHDITISVVVATDQLIIGGADNDRALSELVVQKKSTHETLHAAIKSARELMDAVNRNDYPTVSESTGNAAAKTGRTYDGSPVLYRMTCEAHMGEDYLD
jgi:hypothetical protein